MLNLDTHILLFALTNQLTAREQKILSGQSWSISAIVLWEIAKLAQLGAQRSATDQRSTDFEVQARATGEINT